MPRLSQTCSTCSAPSLRSLVFARPGPLSVFGSGMRFPSQNFAPGEIVDDACREAARARRLRRPRSSPPPPRDSRGRAAQALPTSGPGSRRRDRGPPPAPISARRPGSSLPPREAESCSSSSSSESSLLRSRKSRGIEVGKPALEEQHLVDLDQHVEQRARERLGEVVHLGADVAHPQRMAEQPHLLLVGELARSGRARW